MFNPLKVIEKAKECSYGTGYWAGAVFVVPFIDGFMDAVEPKVVDRIKNRVIRRAIPDWVERLLS